MTKQIFRSGEHHHTYDGDGDPITIVVGPMRSAVAYQGHIGPDEVGVPAVPPSEKEKTDGTPA